MASVADIKAKQKFFVLKKNAHKENLCSICQQHEIIIAMKWGCDYIITTDLIAKSKNELAQHIHVWCETDKDKPEGKPPKCFGEYKDAGYYDAE